MNRYPVVVIVTLIFAANTASVIGATMDEQSRNPREQITTEATKNLIPGDRLVLGRINQIRGDQFEIDIGNPQPLYVPVKPAQLKGQSFTPGDLIVVTLNDHNAVVDYHHPNEASHHHVLRGKLITPLTVGLDKAVIETDKGSKETFQVAERAKGKMTAMPVGADLWFMTDETGMLVDAQLASPDAVRRSAENNKARIKGAHQQVRATFEGTAGDGRMKILEQGREREVPYRSPLQKLDRLHKGQEIVLLMDDQGYVLEIASPELKPAVP